eukprot:gene17379-23681_t
MSMSACSIEQTPKKKGGIFSSRHKYGALSWYLEWAIPGLGMFSEAYIIFAAGQVGPFQKMLYPSCYKSYVDCMLLWGFLSDVTGRKWGSRIVAMVMLTGCIMLTFAAYIPGAYDYFAYFNTSQTWRGEQVVLVFSNQGMGNLVNTCVILISMAIFGETGAKLSEAGSKNVLTLSYGFGAVACLVMVLYRNIYLKESEMFVEENKIEHAHATVAVSAVKRHVLSLRRYWHRQLIASLAWFANDFAFYGNKLQQSFFISLLYPHATPYKKQQWTVLNSFISLLGYYAAAALIDKKWYGRIVGFIAMFVFYIVIFGQWNNMGAKGAPAAGVMAFQFGPNCTTWLVAGEIFPADVRASNHGFAAAIGKFGAIIASLWISYVVDSKKVFLISALWGLFGGVATWIFLPDTTGLDLEEYDRMQRCNLAGAFHQYHGEAVNPKHLSVFEIYVLKWNKNYDPNLDKKTFESELKQYANDHDPDGINQLLRLRDDSALGQENWKLHSIRLMNRSITPPESSMSKLSTPD